jgi:hypothetical protein
VAAHTVHLVVTWSARVTSVSGVTADWPFAKMQSQLCLFPVRAGPRRAGVHWVGGMPPLVSLYLQGVGCLQFYIFASCSAVYMLEHACLQALQVALRLESSTGLDMACYLGHGMLSCRSGLCSGLHHVSGGKGACLMVRSWQQCNWVGWSLYQLH